MWAIRLPRMYLGVVIAIRKIQSGGVFLLNPQEDV